MLTFTFMIDRTMGPGVSFSFARQVGTVEPGFFAFTPCLFGDGNA